MWGALQAWCEVGRATTPTDNAPDDVDGDDWLGSSTQLGTSESTTPLPPSHTPPIFVQGLHSVQELSEDAADLTGALHTLLNLFRCWLSTEQKVCFHFSMLVQLLHVCLLPVILHSE